MLPLMAPQRILTDKRGLTEITFECLLGLQFGNLSGAAILQPPSLCFLCFLLHLDLVPVGFLQVCGQVAPLLSVKVAEVTLERAILEMDPFMHLEGRLIGTGVVTLGAFDRLLGLVGPQVMPEVSLVPTLEVAFKALEGVLHIVLDANV